MGSRWSWLDVRIWAVRIIATALLGVTILYMTVTHIWGSDLISSSWR